MSTWASEAASAALHLELPVRDVMHEGLVDCPPQTTMREVAQLMAGRDVHCIVVDGLARGPRGAERLVWGIVSDLDLAKALGEGGIDDPAAAFAATEPVIVGPGDDLQRAAQLMAEHDCSHLIVADETTGRPVGVLSTLDLARAVAGGTSRPASPSVPTSAGSAPGTHRR